MFRIGEFSKMGKVTIKALRYYDEIGLLKPECIDRENGYRRYTTRQLIELHRIQSFRQVGLPIDEIKAILAGADLHTVLEKRRAELRAEIAAGEEQLSRIAFILSGQEEERFMNYVAVLKELPACTVYSQQMTVPGYDAYFERIPAIGQAVMEKYPDIKCTVPEYCFIIYLDGEYREKDIHVEFCEAVDGMRPDFDDIVFKRIEPVTAVSVMHRGDYAGLPEAYAYAFKWIEENGYTAADNPRESYIDGIWNKDSKEDWLTELQIPVTKK
ncbi:MerR family transcriptional regulator [Intestinibacillus massiliensis]|uniref:MerR family transcriptional regulator n=1 Tax=Intestinibacillus massiliensis TaxID=1871029 RepID=UPI000B3526BD|nr:MerR family transcriptional regulator [Intestinibacillus massiliensis]